MALSLIDGGSAPNVNCRRIDRPLLLNGCAGRTVAAQCSRHCLPGANEFAVACGVSDHPASADGVRLQGLTGTGAMAAALMASTSSRCSYTISILYRAMNWLGDELPDGEQRSARWRRAAPRTRSRRAI
jgi:hypothetical protein